MKLCWIIFICCSINLKELNNGNNMQIMLLIHKNMFKKHYYDQKVNYSMQLIAEYEPYMQFYYLIIILSDK